MRVNFGGSSYPHLPAAVRHYNDAAVRRAGKWGWTTTVTWSAGLARLGGASTPTRSWRS